MKPLHVACAADRRYLAHSAAMLHSLAAARSEQPTVVHFLHGGALRDKDLRPLRKMLEQTQVDVVDYEVADAAICGLPGWGRIPPTMWYRILLPELAPGVDRVLYLDVDVLVVDPLDELAGLDLDGTQVAAVTNVPERHQMGRARELGLPEHVEYFNSGVLLMNLEEMRKQGFVDAILSCARTRRSELLWPDQDALNIVLGPEHLRLHPRWNVMNSIRLFPWASEFFSADEIGEALARPAIVHFEGPASNKPWHLLSDHPYRGLYRAHRRQTPWPRFVPSGLTPSNLIRLMRTARNRSAADQTLTATRPV